MRRLLTTIALSLTLGAGASLPAAAGSSDHVRSMNDWSDGPRFSSPERAERPQQRQRLARASIGDTYADDEEVRPRRSYDGDHGTYRPRYAKRRHTQSARQVRRHHGTAQRPGVHRRTAAHQARPAQNSAARPAWTKKSLSTGGPRGSGSLGVASYYWQPQRVASGGWFNPNALTAAHKTLPFGTRVRVTHVGNGRSVEVTINDRGPYVAGRIIDLSKAAAGIIGMTAEGITRVRMEVLGR